MKISVAAVPYFWSKEDYFSFYQQLVNTDVAIIYLGETVCSKRRSMKLEDWLKIAEMITASGKQAVLSTLTLLEAESELSYLSKIAKQQKYLIEANDIAAVQVASQNKNSFVAGCAVNIYNNRSLLHFAKLGMTRWIVPVELGRNDLLPMVDTAKLSGLELEYQVFGRMPLAYSARCFTARHLDLPKDNCQFKCLDYEQGIEITTQEGECFAQINGIQTQSAKVSNLLNRLPELRDTGIDILRVVPVTAKDTLAIVALLSEKINAKEGDSAIPDSLVNEYQYCNGYWLQVEGMRNIQSPN